MFSHQHDSAVIGGDGSVKNIPSSHAIDFLFPMRAAPPTFLSGPTVSVKRPLTRPETDVAAPAQTTLPIAAVWSARLSSELALRRTGSFRSQLLSLSNDRVMPSYRTAPYPRHPVEISQGPQWLGFLISVPVIKRTKPQFNIPRSDPPYSLLNVQIWGLDTDP